MMWVLIPLVTGIVTAKYSVLTTGLVVGILVFLFIPRVAAPESKASNFFLWPF